MKTINKYLHTFALLLLCGLTINSFAQNPIFSQRYTADPSGIEYNGRLYVYTSHDIDGQQGYQMNDITCMSTVDMVNWTDHGEVFNATTDTKWAKNAWAPSVVYNDRLKRFFLYFGDASRSTGVASSASPTGPFEDARGSSMLSNRDLTIKTPWVFDPTVFIDDDGKSYCYFGGGGKKDNPTSDADRYFARGIELNSDLKSIKKGSEVIIKAPGFFEGAWVHARRNASGKKIYYFSYFRNDSQGIKIDYMTSTNPMRGWVYKGTVLRNVSNNSRSNLHSGIFSFKGKWYIAYHNRKIAQDRGLKDWSKQRSVCVDELKYRPNGDIVEVKPTQSGPAQVAGYSPYRQNYAETIAQQSYRRPGIETATTRDAGSGRMVTAIDNGDWIKVRGVDFTAGATEFSARVFGKNGGRIELYLDRLNSTKIGTCQVGSNRRWSTVSCPVTNVSGKHDLYIKFVGASGKLFDFNWWQFGRSGQPQTQTPFKNWAIAAPGVIEIEDFDEGGEGVAYHDNDSQNKGGQYRRNAGVDIGSVPGGGHSVGWMERGEWLEYTIRVPQTRKYNFDFRYATLTADAKIGAALVSSNQELFSNISFAQTRSWDSYEGRTVYQVELPRGLHVLRLRVEDGPINLDRVTVSDLAGRSDLGDDESLPITVYPNPSRDGVFSLTEAMSWEVFSAIGAKIAEGDGASVDLSSSPAGAYSLRVDGKNYKLLRQ